MNKILKIADIKIDGGTQPRSSIDEAVVSEYADAMKNGEAFPPIIVFNDGAAYWLADGFHRTHAARTAGIKEIDCEIHNGTRRDAVLYSVGANSAHGLRRTNDDKRKAVMTLLNDKEWSLWSNKAIARRCNVDSSMVDKYRKLSLPSDGSERTYTTKHGTISTMKTNNINNRRNTGGRSDKTAPYEAKTDRQKTFCHTQRNKMINMISTASGVSRGLIQLDLPMALNVCNKEEVETWIDMAKDISKAFRVFSNQLQKAYDAAK